MAKQACEHSYRKRGEITLRCRKQSGNTDFCCFQYYCPDSCRYENAAKWKRCRMRQEQEDANR
uniref:Antimicrobial chitin binding protein tachystatin B n=1 Tax=Siphoviridae sp. ctBeL15 TaxID=2825374 RepID=A0A8S5UZY8_9CAUD|nr:MAG TPA: Antimicrobial chitin binding protein tachystatin B [Siphoviridae sp. ctBeL15]